MRETAAGARWDERLSREIHAGSEALPVTPVGTVAMLCGVFCAHPGTVLSLLRTIGMVAAFALAHHCGALAAPVKALLAIFCGMVAVATCRCRHLRGRAGQLAFRGVEHSKFNGQSLSA